MMELALSYTVVECDHCGEEHAAAAPCQSCGAAAEDDPMVVERAARLANAIRLLERPRLPSEPGATDPGEWLPELRQWPEAVASALQAAVDQEADIPGLEHEIESLLDIRDRSTATPRRRPHLRGWTLLDEVVTRQQEVARRFLWAAVAAIPEEAYDHEAAAQGELDACAEAARGYTGAEDRAVRIGEAGERDVRWGPLQSMLAEAANAGELHRLQDEDGDLREIHERITGTSEAAPAALAGMHLQFLQTEGVCDHERLIDVAGAVYRAVLARPQRFRQLLNSSEWWDAYQLLNAELVEAGVEIRRATPDLDRPATAARIQVRFGHLLLERCAKPLLATLLHVNSGQSFARLAHKDAGAVLDRTRQAGLEAILFGLDRALRHADAHREFRIEGQGVRFTASSREYDYLDWDELVDRVLGGLESVFAINLGVVLAASSVDIDVDLIALLDVNHEERAKLGLALGGLCATEVVIEPPAARATCEAPREPSPGFFSAAADYLPSDVTHLEVAVTIGDAEHTWTADIAALRRWSSTPEGPRRDARFAEALTYLRRDGVPAMSVEGLRQLGGATLAQALSNGRGVTAASLAHAEAFGEVARRTADRDLDRTLRTLTAGMRAMLSSTPPPPDYEDAVKKLQHWAGQPSGIASFATAA